MYISLIFLKELFFPSHYQFDFLFELDTRSSFQHGPHLVSVGLEPVLSHSI